VSFLPTTQETQSVRLCLGVWALPVRNVRSMGFKTWRESPSAIQSSPWKTTTSHSTSLRRRGDCNWSISGRLFQQDSKMDTPDFLAQRHLISPSSSSRRLSAATLRAII
jgi:hypothetical protein